MEISGIATSEQAAAAAAEKAKPAQAMGRDDFLRLLTAQLKAQNPLNPMDGTAFTAQLAQFSSLEQLTNINSRLETMTASQTSLQNTMAANLIGKTVGMNGNTVTLNGEADLRYSLSGEAARVSVSIYDASGLLVRQQELSGQSAGAQTIRWDGKDQNGATLPAGQYSFAVEAANASGLPVLATTHSYGKVTGIGLLNNATYLTIDGTTQAKLEDITEITGGI